MTFYQTFDAFNRYMRFTLPERSRTRWIFIDLRPLAKVLRKFYGRFRKDWVWCYFCETWVAKFYATRMAIDAPDNKQWACDSHCDEYPEGEDESEVEDLYPRPPEEA